MERGDKVKMINKNSSFFGKEGKVLEVQSKGAWIEVPTPNDGDHETGRFWFDWNELRRIP